MREFVLDEGRVLQAQTSVSALALNTAPGDVRAYVRDQMRQHIAAQLVGLMMQEERRPATNPYEVLFTLRVIVRSPDEYWRDVEVMARSLAHHLDMSRPIRMEVPDA